MACWNSNTYWNLAAPWNYYVSLNLLMSALRDSQPEVENREAGEYFQRIFWRAGRRSHASLLCCAVYRPFLPHARCHGNYQSFRRRHLRLTVSSLSPRESSHPTGDALLPPPADDCLCPGVDTPNTVGRYEPFPGSEYPCSLPACATVQLVLSARPSGASDWVGCQDLYDTAGGITYLCSSHSLIRPFRSDDSPIRRIRRYETSPPCYAQVIGVRWSAVFRWKPVIGITASFYSALRRHEMSGGHSVSILSAPPGVSPVQPRHTCSRSRVDVGYCYSPLQLDDYTVVIWWWNLSVVGALPWTLPWTYVSGCYGHERVKTFHAGEQDFVIAWYSFLCSEASRRSCLDLCLKHNTDCFMNWTC